MTYLIYNSQLRTESDETVIATILRKGGQEVDPPPSYDSATEHAPQWQNGEWVILPKSAEEIAAAATKASRAAMAAQFESLPVSVQAQFWTTRVAMESAMDKGRFDVARAMLEATTVPAELTATKQALCDLMPV